MRHFHKICWGVIDIRSLLAVLSQFHVIGMQDALSLCFRAAEAVGQCTTPYSRSYRNISVRFALLRLRVCALPERQSAAELGSLGTWTGIANQTGDEGNGPHGWALVDIK